jgi:hypothetical protein
MTPHVEMTDRSGATMNETTTAGEIATRYRHQTPFYELTVLTSPARIEQLAIDPAGRGDWFGVLNNFGPMGCSLYASTGSFLKWRQERSHECGRPVRVHQTDEILRLEGIEVVQGITADWTFLFGERTIDVVVDWNLEQRSTNVWELGWKLDGVARHIGDERQIDLERGQRGSYRGADSAYLMWWEDDPRYEHSVVCALVPGSADRGDDVYVAPNWRRPTTWATWQTVTSAGGAALEPGRLRAGHWRLGFSGRARDASYAAALSKECAGGPLAIAETGLPKVSSGRREAVAWGAGLAEPAARPHPVVVEQRADGAWTLSDDRVLAALVPGSDGTFKAWFYTATGSQWQLSAAGGPTRRITSVAAGQEPGTLAIRASGLALDGSIRSSTSEVWSVLQKPSRVHVESTNHPAQESFLPLHTYIAYLGASARDTAPYDLVVSPQLRPQADLIIGQHTFRAPAVAIQKGSSAVALVPDLLVHRAHGNYGIEQGERHSGLCMDLDLVNRLVDGPVLGFGWRDQLWTYTEYGVEEGYYCRALEGLAPLESARLAYDLILSSEMPDRSILSAVHKLLWERVGHRYFAQSRLPQVQPANAAFEEIWAYWSPRYESRQVGGRTVGAVRTDREMPPDVMFMSWFNALRSSYGLYSRGRELGDEVLRARGRSTLDLLLSAPVTEGAFPTIAHFTRDGIEWLASHRNFANQMSWGFSSFNTFDMGWAAYWVLRWYQDLEEDQRALSFGKAYGDFLLRHQLASGAIPSWISTDKMRVDPHLRESAQTSASLLFLAELAGITGDQRYLHGAEKAGDFVVRECVGPQRWDDYEVYYSNVPKGEGAADPFSRQTAQNNLSMHFAAAGLLRLFQLTRNEQWLQEGERSLDQMLQYQAVWPATFLSLYTFGGFSVQNTDQEWNDARQSQFGTTLLDYSRETGRPDYAERGIASIRAAYATMCSKAGVPVNPRYFDSLPVGTGNENYAHNPYDAPTTPVPTPHFDWGVGSALAGLAEARNRFGDVWVDARHNFAFGIDIAHVERMHLDTNLLDLVLTSPSSDHEVKVKVDNLAQGEITLVVNGIRIGVFDRDSLREGVVVPTRQVPTILHNPSRTGRAIAGQLLEIAAVVTTTDQVDGVTLHYRSEGDAWTDIAMASEDSSSWVGIVPADAIHLGRRLEYYLSAKGSAGDVAWAPQVDPREVPFMQLPT